MDINEEEYDIVTKGLGEQMIEIVNNDPQAMVKRQIPLEFIQNVVRPTDELELVVKLKFPAKQIEDFVKERRAKQ